MGQRKCLCGGLWLCALALAAALPVDQQPPSAGRLRTKTLSADGSRPAEGLEFPNTAFIPGDLTEQLGVDNFFSLWFVFLDDDVFTSDKDFTILAPANASPMRPSPTMEDKDRVRQLLLNHIVLGRAVTDDDLQHPLTLTTLGGQQLHFKTRKDGTALVNGVRIVRSNVQVPHGVILVLDDYLWMELYHGDVQGAHSILSANGPIPMITSSGEGGFPMIELGTHDLQDHGSEVHHHHPAGAVLSPEKISAALLAQRQESNGTRPFYDELIQVLGFLRSGASDFLRYLERSGLAEHFTADSEYTAFVPMDDSFAQWYPIDWGFNPFDVDQFVQETILNHFVSGLHRQTNLTDGQVLTTLGGKKLKISTQPKLTLNGVEIFDGDTPVSRGNIQFVGDLLFVDSSVVSELNKKHRDVESAPLVAHPWYSSQFLSHIYRELSVRDQFSFVLDYLNRSHHELRDDLPSHDAGHKMMRYTFLVPKNGAFLNLLPQDTADPFIIDDDFRHQVLLSHFVRQRLYAKDLVDGLSFAMANGKSATVSVVDGVTRINDAEVLESDIFIYNLGTVFVVDRVLFVDQSMISDVLGKHADKIPSFAAGGADDGVQTTGPVEDTTVVVDLIAELLAQTDATVAPQEQTDSTDAVPSTAAV